MFLLYEKEWLRMKLKLKVGGSQPVMITNLAPAITARDDLTNRFSLNSNGSANVVQNQFRPNSVLS
jgi:hypothetical protein